MRGRVTAEDLFTDSQHGIGWFGHFHQLVHTSPLRNCVEGREKEPCLVRVNRLTAMPFQISVVSGTESPTDMYLEPRFLPLVQCCCLLAQHREIAGLG